MARQDLITCLKNALERGSSIEQAKLSLMNAGYPSNEIEEASSEVQGVARNLGQVPRPKFFPELPKPPKKK